MRNAGAVLVTFIVSNFFLALIAKNEWYDGFGLALAGLGLALVAAFIASKAGVVKITSTLPFRFREILITSSLIFVTIAAISSVKYLQIEIFGRSYNTQIASLPDPSSPSGEPSLNVFENAAKVAIDVTQEEIFFRWIILGSLLSITPPTIAVIISSILFAVTHVTAPAILGEIDHGLFKLLPTFIIGLFCGKAFLRHGLLGSVFLHLVINICSMLIQWGGFYLDIAVGSILFLAGITLIIMPITLWFTRKKRRNKPEKKLSQAALI